MQVWDSPSYLSQILARKIFRISSLAQDAQGLAARHVGCVFWMRVRGWYGQTVAARRIGAYNGAMGIRSRLTRESLARVDEGELEAFFDDVVEEGVVKACEARIWTLGAVLNGLRASDDRWGGYLDAL